MTKIRAKDLRKMRPDDLKAKLKDLRTDLLKINAQRSTGTALENPGMVKQVKKTIARILTIMNDKALEVKKKSKPEVKKKETKNKSGAKKSNE